VFVVKDVFLLMCSVQNKAPISNLTGSARCDSIAKCMRIAAVLLGVSVISAQSVGSDVQSLIDNRVNTAKKAVGIVVGTVETTGVHIYSAGKTSAGGVEKPDGQTLFEIGSITKVFTSLLLADMIERGEVGADDPVSKYLPGNAEVPSRDGKQITLLNLSMQNSGLPRLPDNMKPADAANPYADYDGPKLMAFLAGYKLTRDPGEKYEYSNLAVGLLGYALAQRAHMSYEELVRQRIFKPLHMDSSTISLSAEDKKRLAQGHDAALKPVKNWDLDALAGAGAIRSTAADMLRFLAANMGLVDTPLKAAMERMRSVRSETGMPHVEIAMAWHIFSEFPPDLYWHNGGTAGYRSFAGMDVANKKGIVVLCNTFFDIDDIGKHELNGKYPAPMLEEVHEIKLEPKILSEYEGTYQLAPAFAIKFTARDGRLFTQATGQPEFEVFASKKDEFFLKVVDAQVSFTRDADGKVTGMVLHQGGRDVPGPRAQ
jgi:D-alanyl-D-alanine-carboxypeptidase/D-alanyl-D-alanine-endopeptidase